MHYRSIFSPQLLPHPISSNSLPLKIMRPEEIIFHLFSQVLIGLSLYHSIILYASLSILLSISFSIPYVNVYETVQLKIYLNWRWSLKHGIYRIENNCERIIHPFPIGQFTICCPKIIHFICAILVFHPEWDTFVLILE